MRTRVKICGITRASDALHAAELGADALGLVFYPGSPRYIEPRAAREVLAAVPPLVTTVALFLDPTVAEVEQVLAQLPIDLLQFHGTESPEFCEQFGRRYLKAIPMGGGVEPVAYAQSYTRAAGFLLDSHALGAQGGSGERFDWTRMPRLGKPCLLAGGLDPDNVAEAIRIARPYGVDVSSGVESAKGIKDAAKLQAFFNEVTRVGRD